MLIKALCDYYDVLAADGKVLPEGYSKVGIHYLISLTPEGDMDNILNYQKIQEVEVKGKKKEKQLPTDVMMPQRKQTTTIESNIPEHRPLYIFGLNLVKGELTVSDEKNKAQKSHKAFVEQNLAFIEDLHSPLIDAYRAFICKWKPEDEVLNPLLLNLKNYASSSYAFCLKGFPEHLLHDEEQIKEKWERTFQAAQSEGEQYVAQCAIEGTMSPIARTHNKIKGVYGGQMSGTVLVGYKEPAYCSYGMEQSYNSNISENAMKKYTEALNYLLGDKRHNMLFDEVTVVFWAMDKGHRQEDIEDIEDIIRAMLHGQSDTQDAKEMEQTLQGILKSAQKLALSEQRLRLDTLNEDVDFYMLGLKPNAARLSVKFFYRTRYAELLWNIAAFQREIQMTEPIQPISLSRIKYELISPKSNSEKVNPSLLSGIFETVVCGGMYPVSLLETVVRRVKIDRNVNEIRAGIIKACINKNYKKEELQMALDKENMNQAYLSGRLFAVMEGVQETASGGSLNRTITDTYFASASSNPSAVLPKLMRLAQNHLNKEAVKKSRRFFEELIDEIMNGFQGGFPEILSLQEQGEFIVGYYQQRQSFFEKNNKKDNDSEKEENGYGITE